MAAWPLIDHYGRNEQGRDFIVGDIHGHVEMLNALMSNLDYKSDQDRLYFTGDLGDRGPHSMRAFASLGDESHKAVRGNHELMHGMFVRGEISIEDYIKHGGMWFMELDRVSRQAILELVSTLPLAIEIESAHGLIGIVHSDPGPDWTYLRQQLSDTSALDPEAQHALVHQLTFCRNRIKAARRERDPVVTYTQNVAAVFTGHSIVPRPAKYGNVYYIDTGAYALTDRFVGSLTMAELTHPKITFHSIDRHGTIRHVREQ